MELVEFLEILLLAIRDHYSIYKGHANNATVDNLSFILYLCLQAPIRDLYRER